MNKISFIRDLLGYGSGNERSNRAKKNILASFVIKGLSIVIGIVIVPVILNYIDPVKYGIWMTLNSIVAWFSFFDIGLGNGLRNKFAEALATGNDKLAKTYVSTTYAIISMIICIVMVMFYVINPFLNWSMILNAGGGQALQSELSILALVIFTFFSFNFVLKLIATILIADQKPALSSLFDLIGKVIYFILVIVLAKTTDASLLYLGIAASIAPFAVLTVASLWFFNSKYKAYRPSIDYLDFSKAKDLLSLGIKFFFIQIAVILLYQTNNIIIAQVVGPLQVTVYGIAFKYFSILTMVFSIIVSPYWTAITDAWYKNETEWVRNAITKLIIIFCVLFIVALIMLFISDYVFELWIGDKVLIPFKISVLVIIWIIIMAWNQIFAIFLNGVGKIKIQLYLGVSVAVINIPLAIYLGQLYGLQGILLSNIILALVQVWVYPLQYKKIITKTALGLWNR